MRTLPSWSDIEAVPAAPPTQALGGRGLLLVLVCGALSLPLAAIARQPGVPDAAEIARGFTAVGPSTSEEPAVRSERRAREPSAAFMLGAALGAWSSASAALRYDLETPSGDGDDSEAIAVDCYDDRIAFDHLESRSRALGLAPQAIVAALGGPRDALLRAWLDRRSGQPKGCR